MNLNYLLLLITLCGSVWLPAADGTLNTAFFNAAGNLTPPNGGGATPGIWYVPNSGNYTGNMQAFSVVMQKGKILVGGYIRVSSSITPCILRLFADGTIDTSFGTNSGFTFLNSAFFGQSGSFINIGAAVSNAVLGLAIDANNKIIAGCRLVFTANPQRFAVVRLLEDGGRDITFNTVPNTSYGGSVPGIWYITPTNTVFTVGNSACVAVKVQSDGKIVMAGFCAIANVAKFLIGRLKATGELDTDGFNAASTNIPGLWYSADAATTPVDAQAAYFNANTDCITPKSIAIQSNGRILVAGRLRSTTPNLARVGIVALTSAGVIDDTFNPLPSASATMGGNIPGYFVFLTASGNFSTGFAAGLTLDSQQNIIVTGNMLFSGTTSAFVMRLTPDGVIDTTFGGQASPYGATAGFWIVTSSSVLNSTGIGCTVAFDTFNRIIVAFTGRIASTASQKIAAARLTTDGILDTTFNPSPGTGNPYGGVTPGLWYFSTDNTGTFNGGNHVNSDMVVSNNGQIFLACYPTVSPAVTQFACVSLINKCGILQDIASPFNTGANGLILTTTIDQAGKIVAGGYYDTNGTALRYTSTAGRDGSGPTNFGTNGVLLLTSLTATSSLNKIINAASNTYLATGQSNNNFTTLKLTSAGALDTSFNTNGYVIETSITGTCAGYDMLLNGTELAVAGVTGTTNAPTVINYNSSTGERTAGIGDNGWQQFSSLLGTGVMYGIQTTTIGTQKYGAGQATNTAFVRLLGDSRGLLQDTASPFNTGANGLILTTTIDQAGKIVTGGYYGINAMATRYNASGTPVRDNTFDSDGALLLTSLAATSSLNKIINAASNTYLATGQSNNNFTTLKLTSAGALDTSFNTNGYVIETSITGTCAGYDMLLNGTELAVAGVTGITNAPTVINYNSSTGERTAGIGDNGWQQFSSLLGTGVMYGIQTTTIGTQKYGAGQATNTAFVRLLGDSRGLLQDTASPFNTGANGLILTTTIDQVGKIVTGGYYGTNAMATRYNASGNPVRDNTFDSDGALLLTSLAATSSLNKIINAASNAYLATGQANNQFTTVKLTSAGALDTSFNSPNGFVTENSVGVSQGYDMLLNGTALAVAGVTNTTTPSVINYSATTGARTAGIGDGGLQQFSSFGTGVMYGIQTTTGTKRYGAGQAANTAFVRLLGDTAGILQDTAAPFNTGANALLYSTTITQAGNLLVGGQYGTTWEVVSYTPAAARDGAFGTNGVAAAPSGFNAGRVRAVALDSVGRIIATGATINASPEMFTTVRYNSAGTSSTTGRETTFGVGSGMGIYVNEDDSFEVVGFTTTGVADETPTIMSYDENVNLLNVDQFTTLVPGQFYAMQEADGNFFAVGSSRDTAVLYPLLDGTGLLRDTEPPFNTGYNGVMYGGIYDSNDSIVLCGTYNSIFTVVRYTSVGERDPFDVGVNGVLQEPSLGVASGYAITQDSAGSYYVAAQSTVDGNLVFTVVKYLYSGVLDTTFGNGGIIQETALGIGKASAIKINNDGTIFVGGQTTVNGVLLPTLIKYTATGARFSTFGTNGVQTFSNFGTGTLNDLTIISIRTVAAAGQMGNVATIVQVGQTSGLLAQLNNGF